MKDNRMEYRSLPRGAEQISILGLGTSSIGMSGKKEIEATMEMALENGINYFDMASADEFPFDAFGRAVSGWRDQVYFQVHFGAEYSTGKYGLTTDLDTVKRSVEWQLSALRTDYIDFGFLHCIDEDADLDRVMSNGILDYILQLKRERTVRHIGLSTHTPAIARKFMDTGLPDMIMFSINPAYDYRHGEYAFGATDERMSLYKRCEAEGVGISVKKALTGYQCIQYALDKPGVITVLPGVRDRSNLKELLGFLDASPEEKDYSVLRTFTPADAEGTCVYCNHCQPCPAGLDIGLINKYYDLSVAGDELARSHYTALGKRASDCISCGHCDRRCPFHVRQQDRMKEIAAYFDDTNV